MASVKGWAGAVSLLGLDVRPRFHHRFPWASLPGSVGLERWASGDEEALPELH